MIVLEVFAIFTSAKVLGALAHRLGQPTVVGELIAGVLIGPHVLGWIRLGPTEDALAQIGVIVLLFLVGLESRLSSLRPVVGRAAAVSALGMVLSFAGGWGVGLLLGHEGIEALFLGGALVATSAGVTARFLREHGHMARTEARVIVGAAILDDVLGLAVVAVIVGVASGRVSTASVLVTIGEALAFVVLLAVAGPWLARRHGGLLARPRLPGAPLAIALVLCLGLSAAAQAIGLAALVGAFLAGLTLAETRDEFELERQMAPVAEFLVPFFFVVSGARLDPGALTVGSVLLLAATLVAVGVVAKLLAGAAGAAGLGRRGALAVGVGMVPRGEVAILVAGLGLSIGVMTTGTYAAVIATAVLSMLAGPPLLAALLGPGEGPPP